ncbi:MAG TPA: deoxyribodipyrimidine photo-lyase [Candidatus Binatia bacterium]|nr:deoxyribodipyrimidine photo-lyase [Candidatus Binatia bacterium]
MRVAIHWFRRDLRLSDNVALSAAVAAADVVVPVFVLDPHLLEAPDVGAPRVAFLLAALRALARDLETAGAPLVVRRGPPESEIVALARAVGAESIFANRDYGPYASARDARVRAAAERYGIACHDRKDHVLVEPSECTKDDGTPYSVFTPFARRWRAFEKRPPLPRPRLAPLPRELVERARPAPVPTSAGAIPPGLGATLADASEAGASARLDRFVESDLLAYRSRRDLPALDGTSRLSPHLKFGTLSARTAFARAADAIGADLAWLDPAKPPAGLSAPRARRLREGGVFLNELCWRDFYQAILAHFPHVVRAPFRREFARFTWPPGDERLVAAWRDGRTGFPIVDAGMRQLAETGWMHNRLRMIVATFLTKTLLVDYRIGERIFMERLVDGDVAANNGGWQWCASTGSDAVPYFRIFNPLAQSRRWDADGAFVRRWVPELRDFPDPLVHEPDRDPERRRAAGYPEPCVDLAFARARALEVLGGIAHGRSRGTGQRRSARTGSRSARGAAIPDPA